jgi:PST family polysaccharide transporter
MLSFCTKRAFVIVSGVALGTHGAGLLNLSFRSVEAVWALAATSVSQVALPVLSSVRDDAGRFRRALQSASALACVSLYFGFALLAAVAPEVVGLVFGPRWAEISPYVTVLALQTLVQVRRPLFWSVLTALGRPRDLVLCQAAELACVAGAVALLGVPSVGWAIGIWVARELVGAALETWMVGRATRLGIRELLRGTWIPLIAALAMFAAVWASRGALAHAGPAARLAALALIGAAVYLACVALLQRHLLVDLAQFVRSAARRAQLP